MCVDDDRVRDAEVTISVERVTIRGSAYEDLRPLVQGAVGVASPFLRVMAQLSGLLTAWVSNKLKHIGERYETKLGQIPVENRQLPPLEIAASVVREAAIASDHEDLQELFAELLASGSDTRRAWSTHPAFGSVIRELEPLDAQILALLRNHGPNSRLGPWQIERALGMDRDHEPLNVAISNLVRHELVERIPDNVRLDIRFPAGTWRPDAIQQHVSRLASTVERAFQQAVDRDTVARWPIALTPFGRRFVQTCFPWEDNQPNRREGAGDSS